MRAKFLLSGLAVLPLVWGCTNASSQPEHTNNIPAAVVEAAPPASAPTTNLAAVTEVPMGRVVSTNLALPDTVKLSPAATEIAKMARAGVAAPVMISYVANSVNTYTLAADEIVYLNDIGVHPDVVAAMIQHDQQIREASLNGAMAASPATPAPGASVWNAGTVTDSSNVWQETAAAPAADAEVQTTVPPPPEEERPAEVTVNHFYDSLAPYGTWIDIDGYGLCWRPTVVANYPGWRPYVNNGRWVWTDCGWYWYSDYSWGWAPFHYGRWYSHPHWGWCWVPGTVWGPSWVSWRYTDGYCGWAPLPPAAYYAPGFGFSYYGSSCGVGFSFGLTWDCFTFVSYNNFCGRYYDRHCVGRPEAARIYNDSTVINNVIVGDNNTIINQGIGIDRVRAATRNEIPRANVRAHSGDMQTVGGRRELLAADGNSVTVARQEVPGGRRPSRAGATPSGPGASSTLTAPTATASVTPATRGEPVRPSGGTAAPAGQGLSIAAPRNQASSANEVPATRSSATAQANAGPTAPPARPPRSDGQRGALFIREGAVAATPARGEVRNVPSASGTSRATPWLNNAAPETSSTTPPAAAPVQSTIRSEPQAVNVPSRPARAGGQLVIRSQPNRNNESATRSPQPQTPSVSETPVASTPRPSIAVRSSSSTWRPQTRVESAPAPVVPSWNNNTPARSAPTYSAPPVSQPERPSFSQPAPVQRIERSAPVRTFNPPAQPQPNRNYSPALRDLQNRIQSAPRSQPAPAAQPAPAPAPSRPAAPAQSSAPARGGGNAGSSPGASRPGR